MTECWLIYSASDDVRPMQPGCLGAPFGFGLNPFSQMHSMCVQNHIVVADVVTGDYHVATETSNAKPKYKGDDVFIHGPFEEEKLIYLEFMTGPTPLEPQIKKKGLTESEIKNLEKAQKNWQKDMDLYYPFLPIMLGNDKKAAAPEGPK